MKTYIYIWTPDKLTEEMFSDVPVILPYGSIVIYEGDRYTVIGYETDIDAGIIYMCLKEIE